MKAVIFDMDGVISDTQHVHARIEKEILARYGISMSEEEITKRFAGTPVTHLFHTLFEEHGILDVDIEALCREKRQAVMDATSEIIEIPGAAKLIESLHHAGARIAVASGSNHTYIGIVLATLRLSDFFEVITSNYDVPHPKPAPDIFLLAAQKLGVEPADCVVIEDGISGMKGAKAAGMKCIALVKDDDEYPADLVVKSFAEVSVEKINEL